MSTPRSTARSMVTMARPRWTGSPHMPVPRSSDTDMPSRFRGRPPSTTGSIEDFYLVHQPRVWLWHSVSLSANDAGSQPCLMTTVLDDRKAAILRAVVEEYIETALPVGSASVARAPGLAVSPATVRNDMGALERDGYLAQPHTSAGRIPTDKGYRFFVDSLTPRGRLDASQSLQVRTFFAQAHGELERMLSDTSRFLAGLTDYAAVVVRDVEDPARIRSVQLVSLAPRVVLAVVVLASGAIEKHTLELAVDTDDVTVAEASTRLAGHVVGETFGSPLSAPPLSTPGVDAVVAAAVASLAPDEESEHHPQVFIGGASRMAAAFDAVGTIRQVLTILEQQYVLVTLVKDVLDREKLERGHRRRARRAAPRRLLHRGGAVPDRG